MLEKMKIALFKPINTAAISIMGAFTVLWGLWVGNPFWTVFDQAQLYTFMTILMPEWLWGSIAVVIGLAMLYGVMRKSYGSLLRGALAGFYFWLFASLNFFLGDWQNTGGITLMMIAIYCGYVATNLFINRKQFKSESSQSTDNLAFEKEE